MEHLGDITKISGYTAPIVDCVIGGSPCQGLSQAGLRKGLGDERSGLFMEQIRIIKEMRKRNDGTTDIRPRYMVWENVPGAFSSNKGEDFRIVLEETAKVADKNAVIPEPPKGKWTTSGCIMGDGWSIAWRVLDAQFWGVPQRRRRIALVADFGGHSAPEILFVRKSVSRDIEQSKQKRENSTEDASGCFGTTDCIGVNGGLTPITFEPGITSREGGHVYEGVSGTLRANAGDNQMATAYVLDDQGGQYINVRTDGKAPTLRAETHGNLPCVVEQMRSGGFCPEPSAKSRGIGWEDEKAPTLRAGVTPGVVTSFYLIVEPVPYTLKIRSGCEGGGKGALVQTDKSATLSTLQDQTLFQPVICLQGNGIDRADTAGCNGKGWREDVSYTLNTLDRPAVVYSVENHPNDSRVKINEQGKVQTLSGRMGTGGGNVPLVLSLDRASFNQGKNAQFDFEVSDKGISSPLVAKSPGAVCYAVDQGGGKSACNVTEGQSPTLTCTHGGEPAVCYMDGSQDSYPQEIHDFVAENNADAPHQQDLLQTADGVARTLAPGTHAAGSRLTKTIIRVGTKYTARRLTPLECERLQGYPSELKLDVSKMTKDEYIAYNILEGNIIVDAEAGKVYRTRVPEE